MGKISIHALRGEGDTLQLNSSSHGSNFYPRPPWGGRRRTSARSIPLRNFYPRPPWGGRPQPGLPRVYHRNFYPRPPWGGRPCWINNNVGVCEFLSTPSVGRATDQQPQWQHRGGISIHALRGEGDAIRNRKGKAAGEFLSTPSVGRATGLPAALRSLDDLFLSTPSVGRATCVISAILSTL